MAGVEDRPDKRKKKNVEGLLYKNYTDSVKEVAAELNLYEDDVNRIYTEVMKKNIDHLFHADEFQEVEVRLIEGVMLGAYFVPAHLHEHPRTKDIIYVDNKVKLKCKFSKVFRDGVSKEFGIQRKMWEDYLKKKGKTQLNKQEIEDYRRYRETL